MADGKLIFDTKVNTEGMKTALKGVGGVAGTAMKVVGGAVAGATAAVGAFSKASIDAGGQFDASMSQVAATMGMTTQEIENNIDGAGDKFDALRDKAMEMGRTTVYSAAESAEALNILAMSGYGVDESIGMVDDVLHLAAAGAMDMASAAAYVSGSMKGFNDDTKDSGYYADLMAKGATLANTSVSQLGEAMSGGAASAASYNQSAESMTIALLRLAEQGEAGSAASTALAAAMKNIYTPTDQAKKALAELKVDAYDPATGAARDFNDVVNDLEKSLEGMSDEEANVYKDTIFGIQGLDAFNKMTVTGIEKQEEWAAALAGASDGMGEASKQYETMTDNLEGDIKGFESALEGTKIALSDQLTPTFREFVKFGTDGLSKLTEAFNEDGLEGAMNVVGELISEALTMIIEKLPEAVEAGVSILNAIIQGLIDNLPTITEAAIQILSLLGQCIIDNLPMLVEAAVEIIMMFVEWIGENVDQVVEAAVEIISVLAEGLVEVLPQLLPAIVEIILSVVEALIDNIDLLIGAAIAIILALADGLIASIDVLIEKVPEIISELVVALIENAPELLEAAVELLVSLGECLIKEIDALLNFIPDVTQKVIEKFKETDWGEIGRNVIEGIKNGLSERVESLKSTVGDVAGKLISKAQGVLGIHSPSKEFSYIGRMCIAGMDNEFKDYNPYDTLQNSFKANAGTLQASFSTGTAKLDFGGMAGGLKEALSGMAVTMDGRKVGVLVAGSVNSELGKFATRRN